MRGARIPFFSGAKQSIISRKAFQFRYVLCIGFVGDGTNPWIGSFSLVKQKKPKKGGGCTEPFLGEVRWKPFPTPSLSLPSLSFCWIETTHWGPLIDRTELLGFTTQTIPFLKKISKSYTLYCAITHAPDRCIRACNAALRVTKKKKEINKERRKKFMRKLQTAHCTVLVLPRK